MCCAAVWQMMQGRAGSKERPTPEDAKAETEMIIYNVVSNLLQKTDTKPQEVNCPIRNIMHNPDAHRGSLLMMTVCGVFSKPLNNKGLNS